MNGHSQIASAHSCVMGNWEETINAALEYSARYKMKCKVVYSPAFHLWSFYPLTSFVEPEIPCQNARFVSVITKVLQFFVHIVVGGVMKRGMMNHTIQSKTLGVNRFQPGKYVCSCGDIFISFKSWYRHSVDAKRAEKASV